MFRRGPSQVETGVGREEVKRADPIKCCGCGGAPEAAEERRTDSHRWGSRIQLKLHGEAGGGQTVKHGGERCSQVCFRGG